MNTAKFVTTVVLTALYTASACLFFTLDPSSNFVLTLLSRVILVFGSIFIAVGFISWIIKNWEKP